MAKWKLTLRGTGKLGNSPKMINEVFEIEEETYYYLNKSHSAKEDVIRGLLGVRCPGVEFDINKIAIQSEEIRKPLIKSETAKNIGKSAIAGAIGGAIASSRSTLKKQSEDKEESIPFGNDVHEIANYQWNGNLEDTIEKLKSISLLTTGLKWTFNADSEINKENNRILSVCLKQYENGYKYYKQQVSFKEVNKGLKRLKRRKVFNLYGIFIYLTMGIIVLSIIALIIS